MHTFTDTPESTPSPEQEFPIPGNGADPDNTDVPEDGKQPDLDDATTIKEPEKTDFPVEQEDEVDEDGQ